MRYRKRSLALAAGLALVAGVACNDTYNIPDLNNVSSGAIANGLSQPLVQLLTTGLLNQDRSIEGLRWVVFTETMARDIFRIDPAENRWITEMIGLPMDPSAFTGGGNWTGEWVGIRSANTILDNLHTAKDLTAADTLAERGLVQTIKAIFYYRVWESRDSAGAPLNVDLPIGQYAPFKCAPTVLAYIASLLDSAHTALQGAVAGGEVTFPVTLPSGYTAFGVDFSNVANFDAFLNRGWKGKVEVYQGAEWGGGATAFNAAVTDLTTAINAGGGTGTAALANGIYYTYSTASGDATAPLGADAAVHLNPQVCDSVLAGDARASKVFRDAAGKSFSGSGVTTNCEATIAVSSTSNQVHPMAELRVAELVALRAQAEIGQASVAGVLAANNDVNVLHTEEGGLPAYALPVGTLAQQDSAELSNVLYEKRYSLLLEGGQRIVDLRAYNRLATPWHKKETVSSGDLFTTAFPVPQSEYNPRGGPSSVACTP